MPRLTRRCFAAAAPALALTQAWGTPAWGMDGFASFLAGVRAEARRAGIAALTLERALAGVSPNAHVLELDRHQPEFTLTWPEYRARIISDERIAEGRAAARENARLLAAITARFGVEPGPVLAIWGLESNFGAHTGNYRVVEALATLAWDGRRASYFRPELIDSLRILDHGDVAPGRMTGSWAGAMGQPQFMPSSYLRYAVDFDGDGRRDIWASRADSLASIANYLARSGWRRGEPWGEPVRVPANIDPSYAGREGRRSVGEWVQLGMVRADGRPLARRDVSGALLLPDGPGGEAFLVGANFAAIRRYNPSDFYALAVGMLGDLIGT
jgi:membrane-bound lytic murein transglycosylase B